MNKLNKLDKFNKNICEPGYNCAFCIKHSIFLEQMKKLYNLPDDFKCDKREYQLSNQLVNKQNSTLIPLKISKKPCSGCKKARENLKNKIEQLKSQLIIMDTITNVIK